MICIPDILTFMLKISELLNSNGELYLHASCSEYIGLDGDNLYDCYTCIMPSKFVGRVKLATNFGLPLKLWYYKNDAFCKYELSQDMNTHNCKLHTKYTV